MLNLLNQTLPFRNLVKRNIDGIGEVKAKQIARIELFEKAVLAGDPTIRLSYLT